MTIFVRSSPGFQRIWPYSSNPRRVSRENGHIRPIPAGFFVKMAIFIPSSPGFRWIWPYSSNSRRVFSENGHIHPIPAGFSVNMAIFVQSPAGFAYIHTIFKSHSPRFAWHWSYPPNSRRVSWAHIQILIVTRRVLVSRKDIHPKTCQVWDSSDK